MLSGGLVYNTEVKILKEHNEAPWGKIGKLDLDLLEYPTIECSV